MSSSIFFAPLLTLFINSQNDRSNNSQGSWFPNAVLNDAFGIMSFNSQNGQKTGVTMNKGPGFPIQS